MSVRIEGMQEWMSLLAAIGTLSLAVIALLGGRRSPLARPTAGLCLVIFGWNFSTLAHHLLQRAGGPRHDAFGLLDCVFTALTPPLSLEVVLGFVGALRKRRDMRVLSWIHFGALAAVSLAGAFSATAADWSGSKGWSVIFLIGYLPTFAFQVVLLGRYIRKTTDARERARGRIVLVALAIGGTFSTSDIMHGAGAPVPYLGALGTFIAAGLLTTLVVRLALFDENVSLRTGVYVLGMIVTFVVAYLVVLSASAGRLPVQVFAACLITLLALLVARELALSVAESRARTQRLAVLGRFSAQMAHDIKGPLTALLGAVQVLDADADDAGTRTEFLGLVSEQARRIATIVDRYDRMARVEPRKTLVVVSEVVRVVARAHGIPDDDDHLRLDPGAIECEADRALLESALENVVRNAIEASGGEASGVRLELRVDAVDGSKPVVVLRVVDGGTGMGVRVLERAAEDFFTTKPSGSGLGLGFVRRVIEAHGGTMSLSSRPAPHPEQGTMVELRFPGR